MKSTGWARNPIDAFVLSRLEVRGIEPSPSADPITLIRRLYLDLLGLPPRPEDVDDFLADDRPGAFERLVDRLLASPHFGERWGRRWLDLARYADSDGYEDDRSRPDAWRFRDWVLSAIDADMPFDRFTMEQLAGDLLPDATHEQKVATGFHRMTLFNRAGVGRNDEEFRVKTARDRANTTATVWLALTLDCSQCHNHKYDPLSLREYYQFYAFFDNLVETTVPAPPLPQEYELRYKRSLDAFDRRQAAAQRALADYVGKRLAARQASWEMTVKHDNLPKPIASILARPLDARSAGETSRLNEYFRKIDPEYVRLYSAVLKGDEIPNNRPLAPSTVALTLEENLEPRLSYVLLRGDFSDRGEQVHPGTPEILPAMASKTDSASLNRRDLALWIVDPANPLTSRVAVNYMWQYLFDRGLVTTPENFGTQGAPPTHPRLLDWLADEFVACGWSRKEMIRRIVSSSTYRQSSRHREDLATLDPDNTLLARQNRHRVDAEIVRDLGLACSELLTRRLGGPSFQPPLPRSLASRRELKTERFMASSEGRDRYRRGVYVNVQRTLPYPMMKEFDAADANVSCTRRERSNTPLQALTMLNDPVFTEAARALGLRVTAERQGRDARLRRMFRICLSREPGERESAALLRAFEKHVALYRQAPEQASALLGNLSDALPEEVGETAAAAWISVARILINLDEFITRE